MGHRALVAYQQGDDTWTAHYSHWGGNRLCLRAPLANGAEPGDVIDIDWRLPTNGATSIGIDPDPDVEDVALTELVESHLDYQTHEALYTVPSIGSVGAFLTLDFHLGYEVEDDRDRTDGALVAPRWYQGEPIAAPVSARFRGWKDVYADLVDEGVLALHDAKEALNGRVFAAWGRQSKPGEVPHFSPRGTGPRSDTVNLSKHLAANEAAHQHR